MNWIVQGLVVVHVFAAMGLVAGLVGRELARRQAGRVAELDLFVSLQELAGQFERWLVQPPSLVLALTGIALALLEGYPLLGFLQGGKVNWLLTANVLVLGTVVAIVGVFVPRGKVYEQRLREAQRQGQMTDALRRAQDDRVVRAGHIYEGVATAVIIVLMVTRPF